MNLTCKGIALLGLWLIASPVLADEPATRITWAVGAEFTQGTYGGDADIEDLYIPFKLGLQGPRYSIDLTVPWLQFTGPAGLIITDPQVPVPDPDARVTESGLGDVAVGVTLYDVLYSKDLDLALDLRGKVKFGTADVDKGLGTGEADVTVQADLVKYFDQVTLIGSAGYRFRGDPAGIDLQDSALASIGGIFRVSDRHRTGLFFDYRESSITGEDDILEASLFLARKLDNGNSLELFVYSGFSDSSADWGAGFMYRGG